MELNRFSWYLLDFKWNVSATQLRFFFLYFHPLVQPKQPKCRAINLNLRTWITFFQSMGFSFSSCATFEPLLFISIAFLFEMLTREVDIYGGKISVDKFSGVEHMLRRNGITPQDPLFSATLLKNYEYSTKWMRQRIG